MHRRLPSLLLLVALSFIPGATLQAQVPELAIPIAAGQRTRVTYRDLLPPTFGAFVSSDSQGVVIRDEASNYLLTIPWVHVARIDASVGRRSTSRSVGRGMVLGFLTGVGLGTLAFIAVEVRSHEDSCDCDRTAPIKTLTIVGTPIMTVVGGALGALGERDMWQHVPTADTARLTIGPLRDGYVGVGLGLGW